MSFPFFFFVYFAIFAYLWAKNGPVSDSFSRKAETPAMLGMIFVAAYLSSLVFEAISAIFAGFLAIFGFP